MPHCDRLLTNALVLTMDEQFTVHAGAGVAIAGDSIAAVGPAALAYDAAEVIDCRGRVVMPGLINAHTHVPMTLLRGLADDLRLDVWLMGYMMPVEREFVNPDFVRLGTRLGCAEMIRSGVTCFADMYYFEEAVAEGTAEAGMRALCAQTVLRFPAPDATCFEDSLASARDFIARWRGHSLIVPAPACRRDDSFRRAIQQNNLRAHLEDVLMTRGHLLMDHSPKAQGKRLDAGIVTIEEFEQLAWRSCHATLTNGDESALGR